MTGPVQSSAKRRCGSAREISRPTWRMRMPRSRGSPRRSLPNSGSMSADRKQAPVTGRIWEMMTAPGEDVRAGQALLKLLDCSGAVVTANVKESVYNRLQLGDQASFEPSDGSPAIQGAIVNLTGASGAPANLAINPDVL